MYYKVISISNKCNEKKHKPNYLDWLLEIFEKISSKKKCFDLNIIKDRIINETLKFSLCFVDIGTIKILEISLY